MLLSGKLLRVGAGVATPEKLDDVRIKILQ
jgi:hypothetical protein